MRRIAWVSVALLLSLAAGAMAANKSAPVQLREGLYAEEVEGNLDSAIKIYQQVIDDKTASGDQVAQALYRQGMCYMKKKSEAEAKANFARLVAEHGDQTDLIAKVKPLLEELGNADPAGLMPAETLLYVEIGSPGKQIEAILNLLKGTPLENPLAALGNAGGGGNSQGPAAILSALTNPSMMAEFKKIRGLGVGFQQIGDDVPEAMLVMYPGKSDALRGILQMVLGLIGKSSEAVEGMQAVHFDGGGGAAFDDTVIIVTTPTEKGTERLKWAVQQYKGLANNPTLASGNKPFAKVGKKARQENVVTVWVNVAQAYQTMLKTLPPDQVPEQIRTVDGFVDLKNVDSIIAGLTLKDTGVAIEANIDLKNGHNCQAYHLIRTPPLNMALLQAVPSDATTLVAFGLGDANTPQAEAAGRQIKNALGLDVGPQIFGNIRQVSVFTAPPVKPVDTNDGVSAFLQGCLGVAVTSNDPAQTRSLLTTLLRSAKLLAPAADGQTQEIKVVNGRFQIALANKMQVFGCVDEGSKTTVLALGPALIDSSVKAVRQKNSVLDSGRLKNAVAALPKTTSKLAAVNVGGQMQIAALVSHAPDPNTQEKVRKVFTQLAQICEQTTVLLHTTEETNSLGVRVALTGLPKADQLVGPITELAGLLESGQGDDWSDGGEQEMQMPADVTKRDAKPVVTGTLEEGWASAKSYELKNALYNPISGPADLSASFKAMYDDDKLYLLVDVNDDDARGDSSDYWQDDCVEIFIDADNSRSDAYGDNDYHYEFHMKDTGLVVGEASHGKTDGITVTRITMGLGYRILAQFPWARLGIKPRPGMMFGLDVQVNDDDGGGDRDSKLTWNAKTDNAWENPRVFGMAQIPGLIGWWKLDEKDGRTAADSSGSGHDATVQGNPDWKPSAGKVGGAIALGGDGDFLDVADEASFDCAGSLTLAAWIKAEKLDRAWQAIIAKGDSTYRLQRNNETNTFEFACSGLKVANDNEYGSLFGSKEIALGQWQHVAGVYDGRKMYIYVNGVLDTSQDASGSINTNDVRLQIGSNTEVEDRFWSGLIDEVRIYNYALSQAEVAALAGVK